jgi:hypothetical protein
MIKIVIAFIGLILPNIYVLIVFLKSRGTKHKSLIMNKPISNKVNNSTVINNPNDIKSDQYSSGKT